MSIQNIGGIMKFDKILEYQKIDQELLDLETQVTKSEERKIAVKAKSKLDNATESIKKLAQEAGELLAEFNKMEAKIVKLKSKLDEFDGILDGVADASEADYYIKQVAQIDEKISALEKDMKRGGVKIDEVNANYKKIMELGKKASDDYKKSRQAYEKFKIEHQPRVQEIKAKLDELKTQIPEEFMTAYAQLRKSKKLPAFVEYKIETNTCGRCFMDVPNDTKSKIKKPGDYVECPNCRRIMYIPEQ